MDLIFLYQFPSFLKKDVAAWYWARMVAFRVLISNALRRKEIRSSEARPAAADQQQRDPRSEEHTSELQSLMRISYAVFCLKKHNKPYAIDSLQKHYHHESCMHT